MPGREMNDGVGTGDGPLDVGGGAGVTADKVTKRRDVGRWGHHVRHPEREARVGNNLRDGLAGIATRPCDDDRHCHVCVPFC